MQISLVRIYDNIAHTALVGEIGNLNLAQQANGIALQSRLVDDTGILQDLLLEADAAQQFALLTLGSMILEVLTEVTLVASLSNRIAYGWQLYVNHVLKFGHELIVAFLRHIFHFSLFSSFLLFLMNDDFLFGVQSY